MADVVLYNVAQGILSSLGSIALRELGSCWGVKDELEKLNSIVSSIKSVLLDAEKRSLESEQVKDWLRKLKESVYDADDLLDDFSTEVMRRQVMSGSRFTKEVRLFFSSSNQIVYGFKMAHKIKAIRERLALIMEEKNFHLTHNPEEISSLTLAGHSHEYTHSSVRSGVVGRENDKNNIASLLLSSNDTENVAVIAIFGIGGTGKTTLAQLVFNDESVTSRFEEKIWVSVPRNFNIKLIVENILESLDRKERVDRAQSLETLKNLLDEKFNKKRYLLVLDDVWNDDYERWHSLKDLLMGGSEGSKILVTTRVLSIADFMTTRPYFPYHLNGLSEKDSWILFSQIAFNGRQLPSINSKIDTIAKEIVAKCAGVPLAIKTIARLMNSKLTEDEWVHFKDRELSKIDQNESDIIPTLKLSYNHLPSHLKHCFAFCGLLPKGYPIDVKALLSLWISQGYVTLSDPSQCLEDVALDYFVKLKWGSFFEDLEENIWGSVRLCKMHDLMHDLATSVAGEEISSSSSIHMGKTNGKTRHISFCLDLVSPWQVPTCLLEASRLRTFLFIGKSRYKMEVEQCNKLFSNLRSLRVLDLSHIGIQMVPRSIGKLKHLRYLNLSSNESIEMLPDSISHLQNLLVLKVRFCKKLKQLPKNMRKLINLRHLNTSECNSLTHMPRGIGNLTSLRKLSMFVVAERGGVSKHCGGLNELHGLNNLRRVLRITNLQYVKSTSTTSESVAANLKEKQHLERLELEWTGDIGNADVDRRSQDLTFEGLQPHKNLKGLSVIGFGGTTFPSWLGHLKNIMTIEIVTCKNCQRLPPLDGFESLKFLKLEGMTNLEYIENGAAIDIDKFFPSLEKLVLSDCPKLKGWMKARDDATTSTTTTTKFGWLPKFCCLSFLSINACPSLSLVPSFPTLQLLYLEAVSMNLVEQILKLAMSLSFLRLLQIEDLELLPEELFKRFSYLNDFGVLKCPRLKGLSKAIQHFPLLANLFIDECEELNLINEDSKHWEGLKCLQTLNIEDLPKLESLPEGLQQVATLRWLRIARCSRLKSLPEWISKLKKLKHLIIEGCDELREKCGNKNGEDWHKIEHIPNIKVDNKVIRWNGCYYD